MMLHAALLKYTSWLVGGVHVQRVCWAATLREAARLCQTSHCCCQNTQRKAGKKRHDQSSDQLRHMLSAYPACAV